MPGAWRKPGGGWQERRTPQLKKTACAPVACKREVLWLINQSPCVREGQLSNPDGRLQPVESSSNPDLCSPLLNPGAIRGSPRSRGGSRNPGEESWDSAAHWPQTRWVQPSWVGWKFPLIKTGRGWACPLSEHHHNSIRSVGFAHQETRWLFLS